MEDEGRSRVEKFNGKNFGLWKMQMEDYLYQKDLHVPLAGKAKKPTAMSDEDWELLDRKALREIFMPCIFGCFQHIAGEDHG
ncbi:hypothetical protein KI387_016550, partial [Taxus chinensis]